MFIRSTGVTTCHTAHWYILMKIRPKCLFVYIDASHVRKRVGIPWLTRNCISHWIESTIVYLLKFLRTYTNTNSYILRPKLWTKCCFMKQKCHFQRGEVQYKNSAMSLNSKGIYTALLREANDFFKLMVLKSYLSK